MRVCPSFPSIVRTRFVQPNSLMPMPHVPNWSRQRPGGISLWALLALAVVAIGSVVAFRLLFATRARESVSVITHRVARAPFENKVVERGEVEASSNVEVRCQVKARNGPGTSIVEVVEEGTLVEKGQVVVKLDATALEQELIQQQITCNTKEAAMIDALNKFEAAEIAKQEYIDGTYHQEEQTIRSEILIAEENLRRAREYLAYSERLAARGYVTAQQLEGDQFSVEKAKTELDTANTKLRVLQEYTKPKMLKELDSAIKSAEALWKSEKSSFELEQSKLREIQEQIELCTIRAPQSGQVMHANEQSFRGGGSDFVVEPGAVVRESQTILRLPDASQMQVKAKINEARVTMVQAGMPAKIRLDALGDTIFDGVVTRVNEYPEPSSWFSSQVKEYATYIKILNSPKKIRPGLTAEVTILVDRLDDAIAVPVQAVVERNRDYYCVLQDENGWEARPVTIAATNEKFVVVSDGVKEGDIVAMNPRELNSLVSYPAPRPQPVETTVALVEGSAPGQPNHGAVDGGTGAPHASEIVDGIFQRLDQDKDGTISSSEIPSEQTERLAGADANGDGSIDRAELTRALQQRMGSVGGSP